MNWTPNLYISVTSVTSSIAILKLRCHPLILPVKTCKHSVPNPTPHAGLANIYFSVLRFYVEVCLKNGNVLQVAWVTNKLVSLQIQILGDL